jgi:sugar O-acyltransferase (sialic acid O-acetyltransferase NeuD family)
MTPPPLFVLGASGHGREVAAVAAAAWSADPARSRVHAFLDDAAELAGTKIGGIDVLGTLDELPGPGTHALLGVGYPEAKARVLNRVGSRVKDWPTLIHPAASVGERVTIDRGCFVQAGCVLTCDIEIGEFVTINCGATINHDVTIASLATISPGAHVGGAVSIGEGALLGIGCSVKQGITIGAWSVVGAGAVVVKDVPPDAVVAGVPAQVTKTLKPGWQLE